MATTTAAVMAEAARPRSLAESTVVCNLQLTGPGLRRQLKAEDARVGADVDVDWLHLSKDILEAEELKAVRQFDGATRALVRQMALPCSFTRHGMYLVPVAASEEVDDLLRERQRERAAKVDVVLERYKDEDEGLKVQARRRLGELYRETDYPTPSALREAYSMSWSWLALETPSRLRGISRAFFERERQKAEQSWAGIQEELQATLRQQTLDLVSGLTERLQEPGEGGKRKAIRESFYNKLNAFVDRFPLQNVQDDQELADAVARMRELVGNTDLRDLRGNEETRTALAKQFGDLQADLDALVAAAPRRARRLQADEL